VDDEDRSAFDAMKSAAFTVFREPVARPTGLPRSALRVVRWLSAGTLLNGYRFDLDPPISFRVRITEAFLAGSVLDLARFVGHHS
jgi:hypothetical protein